MPLKYSPQSTGPFLNIKYYIHEVIYYVIETVNYQKIHLYYVLGTILLKLLADS